MKKATAAGWALLPVLVLMLGGPASGKDVAAVTLPRGARIGVVNLLDSEVTHFHGSTDIKASFLKTQHVDWPVDSMLNEAVKQRLAQMGLEQVPVVPSEGLVRGRQEWFIDNAATKNLPKACTIELTQMAAKEHLDALLVLAPGLNDNAHATYTRRKDLPDYLRGWGFITTAGAKPEVFNMTEMLLISTRGGIALLRDVSWGGAVTALPWSSFSADPTTKEMPAEELEKLKPIYLDVLGRQAGRLLDHVEVIGTP